MNIIKRLKPVTRALRAKMSSDIATCPMGDNADPGGGRLPQLNLLEHTTHPWNMPRWTNDGILTKAVGPRTRRCADTLLVCCWEKIWKKQKMMNDNLVTLMKQHIPAQNSQI
ncbi:hypothetical protein VULLAG_LOCUS5601 [Vulpes lagopus]